MIKLFSYYKPETRKAKRDRLRAHAAMLASDTVPEKETAVLVKYGFNHVTNLIESGRAQLVLIANDVDPIELVLWMPTLCVKKGVPFAIIKNKARLGTLVNKKNATCVCLCEVGSDRTKQFLSLKAQCKQRFNDRFNALKKRSGARVLGFKTRNQIEKRRKQRAVEKAKRKAALQTSGAADKDKEEGGKGK